MTFHPLVAAVDCSGKPQPGTAALMLVTLDLWPKTQDWGIYNCRPVRGGSTLSHHAEGRAMDPGIPLVNGRANRAVGDPIAATLIEHAWELGLDHLIWNGRSYSADHPAGRLYTGATPTIRHEDHIHAGQTWAAARSLTEPDIRTTLGGSMAHPPSSIRDWRDSHAIPAVPDWAGWDEYVAATGTHAPSGTWPAGRADLAWFWHSFIEPLQREVTNQASEIAALRSRVTQLENQSGGGSHHHDSRYVQRGTTIKLP